MGDELDGCECIWSHEFAMQRLLAFIRQNQQHCTDTECIDDNSGGRLQLPGANGDSADCNFTFFTMLMVLAVFMYFIRPETFMNLTSTKRRRNHEGQDPNGDSTPPSPPPPAPPAVN